MTVNKPQLRFQGFDDEWEKYKLKSIVNIKSGKDYKHLNDGSIPVYGTGGYMLSVNKALSDRDAIGIGRKGTINKPYLLRAPFWTVDTLFYAVPQYNFDLQFLLAIFKNTNWKKFDESTGVPSLSKNAINNVNVFIPNYDEQKKIGQLFKHLDDTITLHQRKVDLLKKLKKGFLQKMFPKAGSTTPVVRLKGFDDDWEERKLGETKTLFTDGNYGASYPSEHDMVDASIGVPFLRGSDFKDGYLDASKANFITHEKHSELSAGHIKEDDIVLAVRGSLGTLGYATSKNIDWNINSQLAIIRTNKSELSGKFLCQYLLSSKGQKELLSRNTGTALKQLPTKQLKDVPVSVTSVAEQLKIGQLFKRLDDTIILHQRQLDLLKEQKKGLLQQMLV